MKITGVEAFTVTMKMAEPYAIAYQSADEATNVFVRIRTDGRFVGCGAAAPDLAVTGETPETVLAAVKDVAAPRLVGRDADLPVALLNELLGALPKSPAAMAALDMALWDLVGKQAGQPLWRIFGGFRPAVPISVTIGILPLDETLASADKKLAQGFRILKVKGGGRDGCDVELDIERMRRLRQRAGERIQLIFDANQGYDVEQAVAFARATRSLGIVCIEQPTRRDAPEQLAMVQSRGGIPVMADEALMNPQDALRFAKDFPIEFFNVKLMKVGGIHRARQVAAIAEASKTHVMVGCMDEAALSIAAGLHFTLSTPVVTYADLDGHIGLEGDPSAAAVALRDGMLWPSERPGLGTDV